MKLPILDIRHLEMLAVLAHVPRVTDAAEQLRITPSALSHRIREAERRLDVPLFLRLNKRLRPTPAADHLGQVAQRILAELIRAESDVSRMKQGVRHVVRLAVEAYSSYHWLPAFVRHLREREPEVGVQVTAAATRDTVACLADGTVDLIIVSGEGKRPGTDLVHLFDDELVFIMSPDHRLAGRAYIEGPDVVGEDFITYTRVPEPDREYAKLFRPNNTYPNWTEIVELPEAIVEMVAAGLGTSVLARWAIEDSIRSSRVVGARVGVEGISISWYAATRAAESDEQQASGRVAQILADWCQSRGGLIK